jgi:hypothetical protein
MKKSIAIIIILLSLLGACSAEEESLLILPWNIDWDSTMAEYVDVMKETIPNGESNIALYDTDTCYIKYIDDDTSISYNAYFHVDGGVLDTNKLNYQLIDFVNVKAVLEKFETYYRQEEVAQNSNNVMIDKLSDVYSDFSLKYGNWNERYSYIKLYIYKTCDFEYYKIPVQSGEIDFGRIKTYLMENLNLLNDYSIIIANEYSQCGIKVLNLHNSMQLDDKTIAGYVWTAITREKNEAIDDDIDELPQ